jgi:outer membrane murein-binding lipoprotein Lpp
VGWLVLGVWIGAVVLAVVVLAFCLYEVLWKSKRLRTDLERLNSTAARLAELQQELTAAAAQTQGRLADANS